MPSQMERLSAALVGRYTIERELGQGGMATVYLAEDAKHARKVARKVLKEELGAVLGVERFLAEIMVTANLQHPNLLPLFDSGDADGLLFYVMPFVQDEALQIAVSLGRALDYAHRQNVVHRDLKPENVMLVEGQPIIADFGIALAVTNAGGARLTQTGLSIGTPQYMSPEQATGEKSVDRRSDIYALAAVTYEMLAGEPPHTGPTASAIIARARQDASRSLAHRERVCECLGTADRHEHHRPDRANWDGCRHTGHGFKGRARIAAQRARFLLALGDSARLRTDRIGMNVAVSNDGAQIAWLGGDPTPRIFSGPRATIADEVVNYSWGDNDVVAYSRIPGANAGLWLVGAFGGNPERLTCRGLAGRSHNHVLRLERLQSALFTHRSRAVQSG